MTKGVGYKNIPVKEKPWFMKFPVIRKSRGVALFSTIYLRKDLFDKFSSGYPDVETLSVLEHEKKHVERSKKRGVFKTAFLYWLFPKFRVTEELAAIREEMSVYKEMGEKFEFDKRAKNLSGILYLWPISHKQAYHRLTKLWKGI